MATAWLAAGAGWGDQWLLLALYLAVDCAAAYLVYRDARARGMSAAWWAAAVLALDAVGLAAYLVAVSRRAGELRPPSREEYEKVERAKERVASMIRECLRGVEYELRFAGSAELGTFVGGHYDIDAFVVTRDKDRALALVSKCIAGARKEGELDIWRVSVDGVGVDIVFVSPDNPRVQTLAHVEHYKRVLDERKRMEVIKAKILMMGRGCYSAEQGGVTGVALTELVARYGSLEEVCRAILAAPEKPRLPDPTAPRRDLLASVRPSKWECMRRACAEYLETGKLPRVRYDEEMFRRDMERRSFAVVSLPRLRGAGVDYEKALSACNTCARELANLERDVGRVECEAFVGSKTLVAFKAPERLPPVREVRVSLRLPPEALEAFRARHPDARVEGEFLVARVRRKVERPREWLAECVARRYSA